MMADVHGSLVELTNYPATNDHLCGVTSDGRLCWSVSSGELHLVLVDSKQLLGVWAFGSDDEVRTLAAVTIVIATPMAIHHTALPSL
jgi:hypothetical protein